MSTQKTRLGGGGPNTPDDEGPTPPELEELLGEGEDIPEGEDDLDIPAGQLAEDPTGYVPPTPVEEYGGRRMRRMRPDHLQEAHERFAGKNMRMTGEMVDTDPAAYEELAAQGPQRENPEAANRARDIMPDAFRQEPSPRQPDSRPAQHRDAPNIPEPEAFINAHAAANEAAGVYEYLTEAQKEAEQSGDFQAVAYTRSLKKKLEDDFEIQEEIERKERHPVLKRFLANLGVERIKPVEQPWGGFKWMFYPIPPIVDRWINSRLESAMNSAAVELAASTVGMDGIPLYEMLNIPIRKKHSVTTKDDAKVTTEITVTLYKKRCDCGEEFEADAEKCPRCKALHDKFDIPPELRLECAEKFYELLEHKFGPYEELMELVKLKDEKMKSRRFNKEDLYGPFLPSLKKEPDEQSPTQESSSGDE